MTRQIIQTSLAPDCILGTIQGDLRVKGWDLPQVAIHADPQSLDLSEAEDTIRLSCRGDCEMRLPYGTALEVDTVQGDVQIKLLEEAASLRLVQGQLKLRNVAGVRLDQVNGDVSASSLTGDLEIGLVQGDLKADQVEGSVHLGQVQGNLTLQSVRGEVRAKANGDARLLLSSLEGENYQVTAQGDVQCSLPVGAGLRLSLLSRACSIQVDLPPQPRRYDQERVELELGDGSVEFRIEAGGEVVLTALEGGRETGWKPGSPQMADYNEQIARQVEAQISQQMEEVTRHIQAQMDQLSETLSRTGFSPEDSERIIEQAMRMSERETARAQEKMRRAQEKLERKLEETQRKAELRARAAERSNWTRPRHTWGRSWTPQPPSMSPAPGTEPPAEPVSEEERLMILRMLEQKKISLEEAESLLSALEDRGE